MNSLTSLRRMTSCAVSLIPTRQRLTSSVRFSSNNLPSALNLRVPFERIVNSSNCNSTLTAKDLNIKEEFNSRAETIYLPYEGLMVPGMGINSLTGKANGASVVKHGILQRITGVDATTDGQKSNTSIGEVESTEAMSREINSTISCRGSYVVSSGRGSIARSEVENFNAGSTTVIASMTVLNSIEFFKDGELENHAVKLARDEPEKFLNRYGDYYVQGIIRGGYYFAVVRIISESREIQKKMAGSLKASFEGFASGSGKLNDDAKSYRNFSELQIKILQVGGEGDGHANLGSNLEKLSDKLNKFATSVKNAPRTMTVIASPYWTLDNFPTGSASFLDTNRQTNRIAEYEDMRSKIISWKTSLLFVQERPELFINTPSPNTLNKWQRQLTEQQAKLEDAVTNCQESSSQCPLIALEMPFVMPRRKDSLVSQEESIKLGRVWREKEEDWIGIWTRIGNSRIFEASWTRENDSAKAHLEIRITDNIVQVKRVNTSETIAGVRLEDCQYSGILESPNKVSGTYLCPWASRLKWEAEIY